MALHPYVKIRMRQQHERALSGLIAMSDEERQEMFARWDAMNARCDAIKAGDFRLYAELGGRVTPAIQRAIDAQNALDGAPISARELAGFDY